MPQDFFSRLNQYYKSVGSVLKGESELVSVFPNSTDIGISREQIYAKFLQNHLPHVCRVELGGFLFNLKGEESKQLDIIVSADVCPQFNFHNAHGGGKSFSCIEGTLAVATLKSNLDSNQLVDALENIASVPIQEPLGQNVNPQCKVKNYENWPYKVVYAFKAITHETAMKTLCEFYSANPQIPFERRPDIIQVCGEYVLVKLGANGGETRDGTKLPPYSYYAMLDTGNIFGLATVVNNIQLALTASRQIIFNYSSIIDNLPMS